MKEKAEYKFLYSAFSSISSIKIIIDITKVQFKLIITIVDF
jgi:hypothetical protein